VCDIYLPKNENKKKDKARKRRTGETIVKSWEEDENNRQDVSWRDMV
jgi:hypothetical protein